MSYTLFYLEKSVAVTEEVDDDDVCVNATGFTDYSQAQVWITKYLVKYPKSSFDTIWQTFFDKKLGSIVLNINRYRDPF
jgi:hypothetical protein